MTVATNTIRAIYLMALFACGGCAPPVVSDLDSGASTDSQTEDTDSDDSGVSIDAGSDASVDSGQVDTDSDTATEPDSDTSNGNGNCEPTAPIIPGLPIFGTTLGEINDTFDYSCAPLDEDGPDLAYAFENTGTVPIHFEANLSTYGADLDLFILAVDCSDDSCVAFSATGGTEETASTLIDPGDQLFVVVDAYGGESGPFLLNTSVHPVETDCSGGVDDDGDGDTDCGDEDCWGDPSCIQACVPDETITCGDEITSSTEGWVDDLSVYTGFHSGMTGPDRIFLLQVEPGIEVTVALTDAELDQGLVVLDEPCSSDSVRSFFENEVILPTSTTASISYYLVVDGEDPSDGAFTLGVGCRELDCDNGEDDDGDLLEDCDDPDCVADPACADQCSMLSEDAGCPALPDAGIGCFLASFETLDGYCHGAGDAGVGAPCEEQHDCVSGAMCTPADICLMICDLDDGIPSCEEGDCTSLGIDPAGICW